MGSADILVGLNALDLRSAGILAGNKAFQSAKRAPPRGRFTGLAAGRLL